MLALLNLQYHNLSEVAFVCVAEVTIKQPPRLKLIGVFLYYTSPTSLRLALFYLGIRNSKNTKTVYLLLKTK